MIYKGVRPSGKIPFYDIENSHRRCAEGSIANLLYRLGDTDIYEAIKLSVNESDVSKIYHIATGCVHNDRVQKPPGVVKGNQFRDPIMKRLWIVKLSGRYNI